MMARLDWNGKLRAVIYGRRFAMNFDYYSRPIAMSDPGRHAALFEGLPRDAGALAKIVQGLLVHQHIAPAYGLTLTRNQQAQSHVRAVEKILDGIVMRDGRPLSALRAINERQVGVCRHFTLLHVALLRTRVSGARTLWFVPFLTGWPLSAASLALRRRTQRAQPHGRARSLADAWSPSRCCGR
jgi:hypothetical protein